MTHTIEILSESSYYINYIYTIEELIYSSIALELGAFHLELPIHFILL